MTNCNECAQNEILENACLGILSKFQDDLIKCVCKGESTYPNDEESEEQEDE